VAWVVRNYTLAKQATPISQRLMILWLDLENAPQVEEQNVCSFENDGEDVLPHFRDTFNTLLHRGKNSSTMTGTQLIKVTNAFPIPLLYSFWAITGNTQPGYPNFHMSIGDSK
jgi:hypothetical protein